MFILTGLAGMMMLNICYNEAAIRLTLSFAAVLLSLSPVFVMFMAALVFKEKITRRKAGCTFIALIGCILVSGAVDNHNSINMTSSGGSHRTNGSVFLCTLQYFVKRYYEKRI